MPVDGNSEAPMVGVLASVELTGHDTVTVSSVLAPGSTIPDGYYLASTFMELTRKDALWLAWDLIRTVVRPYRRHGYYSRA